jgi:hypothetical protein
LITSGEGAGEVRGETHIGVREGDLITSGEGDLMMPREDNLRSEKEI